MATDTPSPDTDKVVRLADGRALGYAEFGDPAGKPVLCFHGAPSSRLDVASVDPTVCKARGVRLLAVDRPGCGL